MACYRTCRSNYYSRRHCFIRGYAGCENGKKRWQTAFSLIELLVVLAIVALLLVLVIPAYQQQVIRSYRSAAHGMLHTLRLQQEQFFILHRRYARNLTELAYATENLMINREGKVVDNNSRAARYRLSVDTSQDQSYNLLAEAIEGQRMDERCLRLTLNHQGHRSAYPGMVQECWH
ncbi:MAG: type IV pilin protein [Parahaliea sp.]